MWFKAYVQQEHSCGSSTWWPTWKTGLTWKSEELHAFSSMENVSILLMLVDSPPLQCPTTYGTADSQFATNVCLGNVGPSPYILDLAPAIFIIFPHWRSTCHDIVSPVVKMSNLLPSCSWHNRDLRSVHLGWTNLSHTVPSRKQCWKITYYWHHHFVLSVSTGKIFPLICGYCKCSFWSTYIYGSCLSCLPVVAPEACPTGLPWYIAWLCTDRPEL